MNSKEKGDIAIAHAISYYISNGFEVCLPIGDKRHYDFIIEKDAILKKVQVKFAGFYKGKERCIAGLRITGGNQSYSYAKKYKDDAFDLLFIYTEQGEKYQFPWKEVICRNSIVVDIPKYKRYKLK